MSLKLTIWLIFALEHLRKSPDESDHSGSRALSRAVVVVLAATSLVGCKPFYRQPSTTSWDWQGPPIFESRLRAPHL